MNQCTTKTEVKILTAKDYKAKSAIAQNAYKILKNTYREIGGINKGRGFKNPQDMLNSIPVWRLVFIESKLTSVMMFKQTSFGLKMVAYALIDLNNQEVKQNDMQYIVQHSYAELSGSLLISVLRTLGDTWKKYQVKYQKVMTKRKVFSLVEFGIEKVLKSPSARLYKKLIQDYPELISCCYVRKIGGTYKMKAALGTVSLPTGS